MVTFSVIFNSSSSKSNSDKFGNDIMCGAWLLNNAEELGCSSLSCSISSCSYFILHLRKKIIVYFLSIITIFFEQLIMIIPKNWDLDCSCNDSNGHIPDGPAQKICSLLEKVPSLIFFFSFISYNRTKSIFSLDFCCLVWPACLSRVAFL